jgi:hypothetical protein
MADQLIAIKIKYRENRGSGMIRLFWESISQPFAIIDSPRMYYNASGIHGLPSPKLPNLPALLFAVLRLQDGTLLEIFAPPDDDNHRLQ